MSTRIISSKTMSNADALISRVAVWRDRLDRRIWLSLVVVGSAFAVFVDQRTASAVSILLAVIAGVFALSWRARAQLDNNVIVVGTGARSSALAAALDMEPLRAARLVSGTFGGTTSPSRAKVVHLPTIADAEAMLPHLQCDRIIVPDSLAAGWNCPADMRGQNPRIAPTSVELQRVLGRIPLDTLEGEDGFPHAAVYVGVHHIVKRAVDLAVAIPLGLLVVLLVPLLWLAVRLDSPGPLFYSQTRVGLGGRQFKIHKFRSMRQDAEAYGATWAMTNDSRVTRVGRVLRSTRIDELPQVWNIVRGDMSLIGPRPERPEFTKLIEQQYPTFRLRTLVKPGITGWAQICAGYGRSINDSRTKLEYDLFYVAHYSLLFDLKILLHTVPVVIGRKGS